MHSAKDLFPGQYGRGPGQELTQRPNIHEGYGRVDMDAATKLGTETLIIDDKSGVATGEHKVVMVDLAQGQGLRATLSYTDAPATPSSARALVNDLDLQVVAPSGKVYQLGDHTNNSEMLELQSLPAGKYQVIVQGTNVPQGHSGRQGYALLVSAI
jgi:hypothetical protein